MTGPAVPSGLEALLAQATPGPWEALDDEGELVTVVPWVGKKLVDGQLQGVADDIENPRDARLIALAPDAVRLLVDNRPVVEWAASVSCLEPNEDGVSVCGGTCVTCIARALLSRFAALDQRAGTA